MRAINLGRFGIVRSPGATASSLGVALGNFMEITIFLDRFNQYTPFAKELSCIMNKLLVSQSYAQPLILLARAKYIEMFKF